MDNTEFKELKRKAKEKSLLEYLKQIGLEPQKITGPNYWYSSPLRSGDNDPSFKVNANINKWYDWGTREKGDIIDLVMKMEGISFTMAIHKLTNSRLRKSFSFGGNKGKRRPSNSSIQLRKVKPLQNLALIEYVESRGISKDIAQRYCLEAYYYINGKHLFSVAFKNDKGGYELRNKLFKNALSPKFYTTINPGEKTLNLFEGFMDFLSYLEFFKIKRPDGTAAILNGVSFLEDWVEKIDEFDNVNLYLDNDPAGYRAVERINQVHSNVKDWSRLIYPDYNDFNKYLEKEKAIKRPGKAQ